MPAVYNDGVLPYGSRVLTITNPGVGAVATTYIADNIQLTRPTTKIERRNELNEPTGKVTLRDFETGTATLQLATTSTVLPVLGATFSSTFGAASENFYITHIDQPEAKDQDKKVNITFDKVEFS